MIKKTVLMLFAVLLTATMTAAIETNGVTMPDEIDVGQGKLLLNGAGVRVKYVKLYVAGLYLIEKSRDDKKIISADEHMAVRLHILYKNGISGKKWIQGWKNSFEEANQNITFIDEKVDQFCSFFQEDAQKGDVYLILYEPGQGVKVSKNGVFQGLVEGMDFKEALFSIWLGTYGKVDADMKTGLLGG